MTEVYAQWKNGSSYRFLHCRKDSLVRFSHWDANDYELRRGILDKSEVKFKLKLFY